MNTFISYTWEHEHYIGLWGLIIGIPIFIFFIDVLVVNRKTEND